MLATHELLELFTEKGIDIKSVEPFTGIDSCGDSEMADEDGTPGELDELF